MSIPVAKGNSKTAVLVHEKFSMKSLNLSIGAFGVSLARFTEGGYDRTLAQIGETEYSIIGTPLDSGPVHEPKHIWAISAVVTRSQWHGLWAIFRESDRRRREQANYRILCEDSIEDFIDVGGQTRDVAPAGSVTDFGGAIAYPAKFYVRLFEPKSRWIRNELYPYTATFTLKELDKVNFVTVQPQP
jgi:hypothetical protein